MKNVKKKTIHSITFEIILKTHTPLSIRKKTTPSTVT